MKMNTSSILVDSFAWLEILKGTEREEIEDRERSDAYRRQELDAKLMDAAKPVTAGASVKKCPHCGSTVPMQASFCGECGIYKNIQTAERLRRVRSSVLSAERSHEGIIK